MTWFCFPNGWGCYNLNGVAEKELAATFAHGYATEAQAQSHLNAPPTVAQQTLLTGFRASSASPVGAGVSGVLSTPGSTGGIPGLVGSVASNITKGFKFVWPGGPHFVMRLAEGVVGLVLLAIGLNALLKSTTGQNAQSIARGTARTAAKVGTTVAKVAK